MVGTIVITTRTAIMHRVIALVSDHNEELQPLLDEEVRWGLWPCGRLLNCWHDRDHIDVQYKGRFSTIRRHHIEDVMDLNVRKSVILNSLISGTIVIIKMAANTLISVSATHRIIVKKTSSAFTSVSSPQNISFFYLSAVFCIQ